MLTPRTSRSFFFFFNDTATTEIYTLSLHDALPISTPFICAWDLVRRLFWSSRAWPARPAPLSACKPPASSHDQKSRSEEHTSELQSPDHLVCRLLLEKKK